ncbi:putative TetR family transcriptional regulator [Gordonia araii NBRC 100433]|uniref:Putative TetR family transcriptional regulator n=1 Tax=Gordonia araii NBRC 100433 TaxID=1073574 RepID=G7H3G3_9ACTN|nr:TetR family transcriptional regulator [Gordonia araii]NNG96506.1 TetR family transcriptional regulator [Gordonia araii NBRC 100433]GAB10388.1 putative TetR family transcriptional regulator [Gordonia araii NBRC 100433]
MARMTVDQRREALITAAHRVIGDHGVEGATTRRVCAQAQMPLASFHYAFESRTALLAAVIDQAVPRDLTSLADEIRENAPADGLRGVEREVTESMQNLYNLMVIDPGRLQATVSLALYSHNHPELREAGRQMWDRLCGMATTTLRSISEAHGTSWLMDPDELGPLLIAATNAVTMTWLTTGDEKMTQHVIDGVARWMMSYATATEPTAR